MFTGRIMTHLSSSIVYPRFHHFGENTTVSRTFVKEHTRQIRSEKARNPYARESARWLNRAIDAGVCEATGTDRRGKTEDTPMPRACGIYFILVSPWVRLANPSPSLRPSARLTLFPSSLLVQQPPTTSVCFSRSTRTSRASSRTLHRVLFYYRLRCLTYSSVFPSYTFIRVPWSSLLPLSIIFICSFLPWFLAHSGIYSSFYISDCFTFSFHFAGMSVLLPFSLLSFLSIFLRFPTIAI